LDLVLALNDYCGDMSQDVGRGADKKTEKYGKGGRDTTLKKGGKRVC